MLDPALVRAATKLTVRLGLAPEPVSQLANAERNAVLAGLAEAASEEERWWQAIGVAQNFSVDELRDAGVDQRLVDYIERQDALDAAPSPPVEIRSLDEEELAPTRPPTLREVLTFDQEECLAKLLRGVHVLSEEVGDLDHEQRKLLAARIATWWPRDNAYAGTIEWTDGRRYAQERGAAAWSAYARALHLTLGTEAWAQVAVSSPRSDSEQTWLREVAPPSGPVRAAELLAESCSSERWLSLFGCCPRPIDSAVLEQAGRSLSASCSGADAQAASELEEILRQMVAAGRTDLAAEIAERAPILHRALDQALARLGHVDVQLRLAAELIKATQAGVSIAEDLGWLGAVDDQRLLEPLFLLLAAHWVLERGPSPRVSAGWGVHDVVNPIIAAVAKIGGEEAVARYDELLARGGDFVWLRHQREQIAAAILRDQGLAAAPAAAVSAGLPVLQPENQAE